MQAQEIEGAGDGRHILLNIAAGSGLAEYMVTGDASNANYSSSMVAESPAVKEFEDIQDESKDAYIEIWDRVMENGMRYKKGLPKKCFFSRFSLDFVRYLLYNISMLTK